MLDPDYRAILSDSEWVLTSLSILLPYTAGASNGIVTLNGNRVKRNSNRATRKGFSLPVMLTALGLIVNPCKVMIYDNFINMDQWFLIKTTQLGIPPSSTLWEEEQSSVS